MLKESSQNYVIFQVFLISFKKKHSSVEWLRKSFLNLLDPLSFFKL
jgi:hypothetical protein